MKRGIWLVIVSILVVGSPSWLRAQEGGGQYNHGTFGIYSDYFRFSPTSANTTNFVGFGARTAFNASRHVQLEGEMNYDFERNFTTTCSNCVGTTFVTTKVRPLTGLFGPKFETPGNPGTVVNAISGVGGAGTHFAMYPGAGFEGFWGPFGLRMEAGDEVYLNNGTFNNLRVTFGPQLRF